MKERIETFSNNCTLVAVKSVLNGTKTDDEILAAFREENYRDNQGMTHHRWTSAAERLGLKLEKVKLEKPRGTWQEYEDPYWGGTRERYIRGKVTIGQFCKLHPEGVFFISTVDHALVIVNGSVWDQNCVSSGLGRAVESAKRVLNSPLQEIEDRPISWIKRGRFGTDSYYRRASAMAHISNNGPCSWQELVEETQYTEADHRFDKRRGNLKHV